MLHYIHQLAVLFGAEQVVLSGFIKALLWDWTRAVKLWAGQLDDELKIALKLCKAEENYR